MRPIRTTAGVVLAALAAWASATPDALALQPQSPLPEDLPEVRVLASRVRLRELHAEIVKAEDDFYSKLNSLMDDPEMHVVCETRPPLGSRIFRRTCGPVFVATANATYAREMSQSLSAWAGLAVGSAYLPPESPGLAIVSNEGAFEQKVVALMNEHADLRDLAKRRESLAILMRAAEKARFGRGSRAEAN